MVIIPLSEKRQILRQTNDIEQVKYYLELADKEMKRLSTMLNKGIRLQFNDGEIPEQYIEYAKIGMGKLEQLRKVSQKEVDDIQNEINEINEELKDLNCRINCLD